MRARVRVRLRTHVRAAPYGGGGASSRRSAGSPDVMQAAHQYQPPLHTSARSSDHSSGSRARRAHLTEGIGAARPVRILCERRAVPWSAEIKWPTNCYINCRALRCGRADRLAKRRYLSAGPPVCRSADGSGSGPDPIGRFGSVGLGQVIWAASGETSAIWVTLSSEWSEMKCLYTIHLVRPRARCSARAGAAEEKLN